MPRPGGGQGVSTRTWIRRRRPHREGGRGDLDGGDIEGGGPERGASTRGGGRGAEGSGGEGGAGSRARGILTSTQSGRRRGESFPEIEKYSGVEGEGRPERRILPGNREVFGPRTRGAARTMNPSRKPRTIRSSQTHGGTSDECCSVSVHPSIPRDVAGTILLTNPRTGGPPPPPGEAPGDRDATPGGRS